MKDIINKSDWMTDSQKEFIDELNFDKMYKEKFGEHSLAVKRLK